MMILFKGTPDLSKVDFGKVGRTLALDDQTIIVTSISIGQLKALRSNPNIIDFVPDGPLVLDPLISN